MPHTTAPPPPEIDPSPDDHAELRRHLIDAHLLWVDPYTAAFLARAAGRELPEVRFVAACARTGRSAFHTIPASALRAASAPAHVVPAQ